MFIRPPIRRMFLEVTKMRKMEDHCAELKRIERINI